MDKKDYTRAVSKAIRMYFRQNGITYQHAARKLGYASESAARNQASLGRFGKRVAAKWAKTFGFSERFLMTGCGKLVDRPGSYRKLVREVESLNKTINEQRLTIERLESQIAQMQNAESFQPGRDS